MFKTTSPSFTACAVAVLATLSATTALAADKERLFSVPFFLGGTSSSGNPGGDFTLTQPAILESYALTCNVGPEGGFLEIDGGPSAANGTTAVAADASSYVSIADAITLPITFQYAADGNYHAGPIHVGAPVSLRYHFRVISPASGQAPGCYGYATFRTL
jgi:hypothetical protein